MSSRKETMRQRTGYMKQQPRSWQTPNESELTLVQWDLGMC
jgi:hypothetical protein